MWRCGGGMWNRPIWHRNTVFARSRQLTARGACETLPSLTQLACSGASPRTVDEFCQLLAIGKRSLAPRSLHRCLRLRAKRLNKDVVARVCRDAHSRLIVGFVAMLIPRRLKKLERDERGRCWLADLPRLVAELAREWDLELGTAYEGASVSYVAPVARGAERMVLKMQWPHDECMYEADALLTWDGDGAVRLLAHDVGRHALLLERCSPGTRLAADDNVDRMAVMMGILPRLWKPAAAPFRSLTTEAKDWAASLLPDWEVAGKPCERRLIDAAAGLISE